MAQWLEGWLDKVCALMAVTDVQGRQVYSFQVFAKNEMPEAISPELVPCAYTYVDNLTPEYSTGGPSLLFWEGVTEFHLTKDVKPANISYILTFFEKIITAAAGDMTLDASVELFLLKNASDAVQFVTYKNADGRDDHQGVLVRWQVKQNISGQLTVSA